MNTTIDTPRLQLVLDSTEAVLARIDAMSPADRAEVSPDWVARMRGSTPSPWTHGFTAIERATKTPVGGCAFKGPPDADGVVEIAYGIEPAYRGRGYAKDGGAHRVIAHTRPENGASAGVLRAAGFELLGEVNDPEDGLVWRWEYRR